MNRPRGFSVVGLLALVGFTGAANADATIDLLWGGVSTFIEADTSSTVSLHVVLTNFGPFISQGGGVSIDYSEAGDDLVFLSVDNNPNAENQKLPITLESPFDTGTQVRNINANAFIPLVGTGLAMGETYLMGTIQFRKGSANETFEIVSLFTGTDGLLLIDEVPEESVTFNSAFIVPEPEAIASMLAATTAVVGIGWIGRRRTSG